MIFLTAVLTQRSVPVDICGKGGDSQRAESVDFNDAYDLYSVYFIPPAIK